MTDCRTGVRQVKELDLPTTKEEGPGHRKDAKGHRNQHEETSPGQTSDSLNTKMAKCSNEL